MGSLIISSSTAHLVLRQAGQSHMRNVIGPAATAATLLAPQSFACAAAFSSRRPAPYATSPCSSITPGISQLSASLVGNTRVFHASAPVCKKRRNKWKSAKKYLAMMEEMEAEEGGVDPRMASERTSRNKARGNVKGQGVEENDEQEQEGEPEELYDDYDPPDSVVYTKTLDWIKQVVVGLNLCPFAASPLASNKLSIEIIRGRDAEAISAAVLLELILRVGTPGTTVVVAPECSPDDFETYLQVLDFIELIMEEHELVGKVQVAPFHPLFEFGGRSDDEDDEAEGIDNYTNRSPFPMFHVLREEEVGAAVDKLGGDASVVFDRNIRLMKMLYERLGRDGVEKVMTCDASSGDMKKAVEEVLKAVVSDEENK